MTPVGHTIAGVWSGGLIKKSYTLKCLIVYTLIASLPDFDIIVGFILFGKKGVGIHQYYTHNFLFIFLTALLIYILTKDKRLTIFTIVVLTIHLFLDLIVIDKKPPIGINPFYPFYNKFYNIPILLGVKKCSLKALISLYNLKEIILEIVVLSPLWIYSIIDYLKWRKSER